MPSADNELWDRGHPRQPGDNAGSIARQTVCKWRSHRERKFFVLSSALTYSDGRPVATNQHPCPGAVRLGVGVSGVLRRRLAVF